MTRNPTMALAEPQALAAESRRSQASTRLHRARKCRAIVTVWSLAVVLAGVNTATAQVRCAPSGTWTCVWAVERATAQADGSGPPTTVTIEPIDTPLGSRIPLLLIHGIDLVGTPASPSIEAFDNLLVYLKLTNQGQFYNRFKPYRVEWFSNRPNVPVTQIASELADALAQWGSLDPSFGAAQIAIVAHSTGGLIARSLMQEIALPGGQLWHSRVARLITLATPHHGSPAGNGPALDESVGGAFLPGVTFAIAARKAVDWSQHYVPYDANNRSDLHWDNFSAPTPLGTWNRGLKYYLFPAERNQFLERLNSTAVNVDSKVVAYAGYIDPCLTLQWEQLCLSARFLSWSRVVSRSDGIVPVESALFYRGDGHGSRAQAVHVLEQYDHSEMRGGKLPQLCAPSPTGCLDDYLFNKIRSDLQAIPIVAVSAEPPRITSLSPGAVVGSSTPTVFTITGSGFVSGSRVSLVWSSGQSGSPSGGVTYVSSSELRFGIATGTAADTWSVRVVNPDGQLSTPATFRVTAPPIPNTYRLTTNALHGAVTVTPAVPNYPPGSLVALTAVPTSGYVFLGWTGDAIGTTNPVSITMDRNKSVTAVFVPATPSGPIIAAVTVANTTGCLGVPTAQWVTLTGSGFASGAYVLLGANGWTGAISAGRTDLSSAPAVVRVCSVLTQATQWSAQVVNPGQAYSNTFQFSTAGPSQFTIVTSSSSVQAGEVSAGGTYVEGSNVIVVAYPYTGYQFVNWTDNGNIVSASSAYSLRATSNRTLVANFATTISPPLTGSITANIATPGALAAGAGWRLSGENLWRSSGTKALSLTFGTYTIEYKQLPTWNPPPNQVVQLVAGTPDVSVTSGNYAQPQLNAPSSLTATVAGDGTVVLNWQDNSSNESFFRIERKTQGNTSFSHFKWHAANTTADVNGPYPSFFGSLCYRVRAVDATVTIYSEYSNEACVIPNPLPIDAACYAPISGARVSLPNGRLAGGSNQVVALGGDGTVWRWGQNEVGAESPFATPVAGLSGIGSVSMGYWHGLALRRDGTVWAWGRNAQGQLGDGTLTDRPAAVQVPGLSGIVAVAAGYYHSLALGSDGTVWTWGSNSNGQLGDGTRVDSAVPRSVTGVTGISQIAAGQLTSWAVATAGTVSAWGANSGNVIGTLGVGNLSSLYQLTPAAVLGIDLVATLSAGDGYALAARQDGTVWAWGDNRSGRIGDGSLTGVYTTPFQIAGLQNVVSVSAGNGLSLALRSDGTAWAWGGGSNQDGGVGDGSIDQPRHLPTEVVALRDVVAVTSTSAWNTAIAMRANGTVCAWGANSVYTLGDGGSRLSRPVAGRVVGAGGVGALGLLDETPDSFEFGPRTVTVPQAQVVSNSITVSGVDGSTTVFVTGGEFSVNGGAFTTSDALVSAGDTVALRATAPSTPGQSIVVVTIGGVQASFTVALVATQGPVAIGDSYVAASGTTLSVPAPGVLANDTSPGGGALTAMLGSPTSNGTVSLNADGSFTYTSNTGFLGSDAFTYRAQNLDGLSPVATVNIVVGAPILLPPMDLFAAQVAGNTVMLKWTPAVGGLPPGGYVLEGGVTPGQPLAALPTGSTDAVYTFDAPSGSFYVRVRAVSRTQSSPPSNEIRIHVGVPVPPSPPANLLATVDGSALSLAWRNTYAGGAPTSLLLDVGGALSAVLPFGMTNNLAFAGVPPGTFTLSLRAVNGSGTSGSSNPVTVTFPQGCTGSPLPPTHFVAWSVGRTITVSWDPATAGGAPTGYLLSVGGSVSATLPLVGSSISGAVPPGTYVLAVTAVNSCGSSSATAPLTVVVP